MLVEPCVFVHLRDLRLGDLAGEHPADPPAPGVDVEHAHYSATLELDLADVKPSLAGPKRPQDRVLLEKVQDNYRTNLEGLTANRQPRKTEVKRMC